MQLGTSTPDDRPDAARIGTVPRMLAAATLPYAVLAGLAPVLGRLGVLNTREAAAGGIAACLGGAGAAVASVVRRQARLWAADAWLAHGTGPRPADDVLRQRSAGLVAARHRRLLAGTLRRFLNDAEQPTAVSGRMRLDRAAVAACAPLLERVADGLGSIGRPITPRAVALADELVTSPGSPLYRQRTPGTAALKERLRQLVFELERAA
jgi:hypothetical protein